MTEETIDYAPTLAGTVAKKLAADGVSETSKYARLAAHVTGKVVRAVYADSDTDNIEGIVKDIGEGYIYLLDTDKDLNIIDLGDLNNVVVLGEDNYDADDYEE
jgi:hypothetical protein